MTSFTPLRDKILVSRSKADTKTKGGLFIPETVTEKPLEGTVIAVGKGAVSPNGLLVPNDIRVGDVILFGKYAGTEVVIDDVEHIIMGEGEVLGIISRAAVDDAVVTVSERGPRSVRSKAVGRKP